MAQSVRRGLNVPWGSLAFVLLLGTIGSFLLAFYVTSQRALGAVFLAVGIWGATASVLAVRESWTDSQTVRTRKVNGPIHVYAVAHVRREIIRFMSHMVILTIGILSVVPSTWVLSWFGTYFTAAMFFLAFSLALNGTLDATLRTRMNEAAEREIKEAESKKRATTKRKPKR